MYFYSLLVLVPLSLSSSSSSSSYFIKGSEYMNKRERRVSAGAVIQISIQTQKYSIFGHFGHFRENMISISALNRRSYLSFRYG